MEINTGKLLNYQFEMKNYFKPKKTSQVNRNPHYNKLKKCELQIKEKIDFNRIC